MTIDFTCQECDGSFELDFSELQEAETLRCPNCGQESSEKATEDLAIAMDEFFAQLAKLRSRFVVSLSLESDDLPPPYDLESDEEDEDDEDEDEEDEDDEDFDDEDYDDEDDEDYDDEDDDY